jgi:hypothetical protein
MDTMGTSTDLSVGGTSGNTLCFWSEYCFLRERCGDLPGNLLCVSERDQHLIHHFIRANNAAKKTHFQTGRVVGSEYVTVKAIKLISADPTSHGRYVINVGYLT